ncbi:DUF7239 family protein [Streptomyces fungicidicus]|uniref:DUF7239 family protein n=1 Tax=Streptomyces fungicidicus TaxID=68203 RepID=UPI003678CE6F
MATDLTPDPREAKLPKWAVAQLRNLRMEVRTLEVHLKEAKGDIPDADTFLVDYARGNTPLPRDARIGFNLRPEVEFPGRHRIMCYLDDRGWLQIQGDYSLRVQPRASNSLMIRLEDTR